MKRSRRHPSSALLSGRTAGYLGSGAKSGSQEREQAGAGLCAPIIGRPAPAPGRACSRYALPLPNMVNRKHGPSQQRAAEWSDGRLPWFGSVERESGAG
ncbi:MAG: hypothetical protein ACRENP_18105, partial [Longimicrobiales bacterium]